MDKRKAEKIVNEMDFETFDASTGVCSSCGVTYKINGIEVEIIDAVDPEESGI